MEAAGTGIKWDRQFIGRKHKCDKEKGRSYMSYY
jgi:hypothetical protein